MSTSPSGKSISKLEECVAHWRLHWLRSALYFVWSSATGASRDTQLLGLFLIYTYSFARTMISMSICRPK
jgi:hypothetical protein